ncbi:MAG: DUF2510 domain-containing protein, partial [Trebonia sp.]
MELPPSGWYPDPYGTPSLLRWWDGSGWTQHTHPDVTAGASGAGGSGGDPAATALQATAVQAAPAHVTAVQATAVQATAVQGSAVQATTVQAATGPSTEWLSRTSPPTGRPTAPQPALPEYPGAAVGLAPTAYQSPVTTVQTGGMQPGYQRAGSAPPMAGQAGGGDGTQVLFLGGDAWQVPGGPGQGNPYGYMEAQRRRRRRVIIGLSAGTAVAIGAIVIIATSLSSSPS